MDVWKGKNLEDIFKILIGYFYILPYSQGGGVKFLTHSHYELNGEIWILEPRTKYFVNQLTQGKYLVHILHPLKSPYTIPIFVLISLSTKFSYTQKFSLEFLLKLPKQVRISQ